MKVILSHPTGNANVRAVAKGLIDQKLLFQFYTSIASFPGTLLNSLSTIRLLSDLKRREFHTSLKNITRSNPWLEVGRIIASKTGFARLIKHETGIFCIDEIYRSIDKSVALKLKILHRKGVKGVYAYEDAAFYSFREAKIYGIKCLYDLPIGYWRTSRKLLETEKEKCPDWSVTLSGFNDSPEKLEQKDEELRLADSIFVASTFTAKSLQDFPGALAPVKIIPYGFPPVCAYRQYNLFPTKSILKLLFVGGLSQRKGISYLFTAVEAIGSHVELTIVGNKTSSNCNSLNVALKKHRWYPSLPHEEILQLMRSHDVLVFPSLFEGFGLVITEAMSQGMPVITTDRTVGPELIQHGENGWLIEAGSTESLKTAIENLLYTPGLIKEAGMKAMETAKLRPWSLYGKEIAEAVIKNINQC